MNNEFEDMECRQRECEAVDKLDFLGNFDAKEGIIYALYMQRRELLIPYITLKEIPESPTELYWLAKEA